MQVSLVLGAVSSSCWLVHQLSENVHFHRIPLLLTLAAQSDTRCVKRVIE